MKVIIKKYPKLPQAREIIGKTQEPSYYFEKMQGLDPAYVVIYYLPIIKLCLN